MGIQRELHPQSRGSNKTYLSPACMSMNSEEKNIFCSMLKSVKVPDGYALNISRCVDIRQKKINSLKSHDCHIIMEQLQPIALRIVLSKNVNSMVIELCSIFKELCYPVLRMENLIKLQSRIIITLCQLESIFPPSFYTIMVHLVIHLPQEAMFGGPVQYRWMYPIERYLQSLYF